MKQIITADPFLYFFVEKSEYEFVLKRFFDKILDTLLKKIPNEAMIRYLRGYLQKIFILIFFDCVVCCLDQNQVKALRCIFSKSYLSNIYE
jgi:hypothetical protein